MTEGKVTNIFVYPVEFILDQIFRVFFSFFNNVVILDEYDILLFVICKILSCISDFKSF